MYIRQYGLQRNPFRNAPGSTLFYTSYNHKGIVDTLVHGIRGRYGLHLVTGENGTGKTTMARFIQMAYSHEFNMAYLGNPFVTDTEFFNHIIESFGGSPLSEASPKQQVDSIIQILSVQSTSSLPFVLLVDEAHHLSRDIFDHLLVLANLQHNGVPMLQTVLLGLPALQDMLSEPHFGSLNQRIGSRCIVRPMQREETGKYINYRLNKAGCRKQYLFEPRAIRRVHKITGGKPRLINHLCSLALEEGARQTRSTINVGVIRTVLKDPAYTALFFPDKTGDKNGNAQARRWALTVAALILTCSTALGAYVAVTGDGLYPLLTASTSQETPQASGTLPSTEFLADLEVPSTPLNSPKFDLPDKFPVSMGKSSPPPTKNKNIVKKAVRPTVPTPTTDNLPPKALMDQEHPDRSQLQRAVLFNKSTGPEGPTVTTRPDKSGKLPQTNVPNHTPAQQMEYKPPSSTPALKAPSTPPKTDAGTTPPLGDSTQSLAPDLPHLPDEFSDVRLNALVWDSNPVQRMAVINSQILREKNIFGRLTVLNIGKGYVILGYANQRFLLEPITR